MRLELYPFQIKAVASLRKNLALSRNEYRMAQDRQVISFTAPTGAGKTIIAASLIEQVYAAQPDAIFVWLSDSPELNQQSRDKIDLQADKINLSQCVTIETDSFDQEMLDDGHIYFLNTQKLSKTSNLTNAGDTRQYSIWQTLENTIQNKADRLYLIIDEAHRGALSGRKMAQATSIMQRFIKGDAKVGMEPFPIVIGMSATPARFNNLVKQTNVLLRKTIVAADDVRSSGLLKDRIIVKYPKEKSHDEMAILQAAATDWQNKWVHWSQYCQSQKRAYVNPIFLIQVENGNKDVLSKTDLDSCLRKIESNRGEKFSEGEVVHAFGDTKSDITIDGLKVPYKEPSQINDDKLIKVVFFKESLSTGWDCPRAETMISFRHAKDATYIAQLLGRMIRTPMQMRIQVDPTLNDVYLYLPYFDKAAVKTVIDALQSAEGSNIPADVYGEEIGQSKAEIWSALNKPRQYTKNAVQMAPNQGSIWDSQVDESIDSDNSQSSASKPKPQWSLNLDSDKQTNKSAAPHMPRITSNTGSTEPAHKDNIDRIGVIKAVNRMNLTTYVLKKAAVVDPLTSLFKLVHFLTINGFDKNAVDDVQNAIVKMIHDYIESLVADNKYEDLAGKATTIELSSQTFDILGKRTDAQEESSSIFTTSEDIDRQFGLADRCLANEGIGLAYGNAYAKENNVSADPNKYKIDVILFAGYKPNLEDLDKYAKQKFNEYDDKYRVAVSLTNVEKLRKQYNDIVTNNGTITSHAFALPFEINGNNEQNGDKYYNHLYLNDNGYAKIRLNNWEKAVIKEESARDDFVTWLRFIPRAPWALAIPYQLGDETKVAYPDFMIIRKQQDNKGYIADVLEPHNPKLDDNFGKAQAFAKYVKNNPSVGRFELIKQVKSKIGNKSTLVRLNLAKREIQDKVLAASGQKELNHIFDDYGSTKE